MGKTTVILTNLGTPDAPTKAAVKRYLKIFLSDPRVVELPKILWRPLLYSLILPWRSGKSAHAYQSIWRQQGSPLLHFSQQLTNCVRQQLSLRGHEVEVVLAMRYGQPSLSHALQQLTDTDRLVVLPMYPQYASATTGSTLELIYRSLAPRRKQPSLYALHAYHNHPLYIEALAQSVRQSWQQHGRGQCLILSFHGIPQRSSDLGDPYEASCRETAQLLVQALDLRPEQYRVVFQSRFGKATWLQPYCVDTLQSLPQSGVTDVDILCPGFAVDCLETLEEIALANQEVFMAAGGKRYHYIPCLNKNESQVALYCQLLTPLLGP